MVDAVVSLVLNRLGDYLIREASFLGEVRKEVESLTKELEWMRSFIKDAEDKQVDNALIRQWVFDIKDIAYDSEDVLDKFMLQVRDKEISSMLQAEPVEERETHDSERRQGFFNCIWRCSCLFAKTSSHCESSPTRKGREMIGCLYNRGKEKIIRYGIGKEIEALKKRLNDVSRRRIEYGIEQSTIRREGESHADGRLKQLRKTTSFTFEENVVGYEDDMGQLLAKLLDYEPARFVISIWGTGGLGKTTLARKLYHDNTIKKKFGSRAWVCVSQDYSTRDLLLRIIRSFNFKPATDQESKKMKTEEDLERYIHESLQGHSYLVVIDDVWHKEAWASLKRAFPDNKNGSRVIITTRNKDVAQRSDERTHVHELRFLRQDESWQLFCEKAFRNLDIDSGLEMLGREMVEKCGGLPLAIVVLGGFLSTKKPQEWHLVRDRLWRNLSNDSIQISSLLALSFNDLSYQLKLCFLYLGYFPEDYEIDAERLIRLWVAEGFIPKSEETMEDVAFDNLNELINRSLIQIDKKQCGRIITCRVHDLLRDLAIQIAKELNSVQIYDETENSTISSRIPSCRGQAVYFRTERCLWLQQCNPRLRSFLFFFLNQKRPSTAKHVLPIMCTKFRFLRVLYFELSGTPTGLSFPEGIGKLIHLKYLGIRGLVVQYIPTYILNLSSLETLELLPDLEVSIQLPTEICRLQQLRHLIGSFAGEYFRIDNLTNLQTLKYIRDDTWTKTNPEKLVNLRELHITLCHRHQKFTFDSIAKLKKLRILSISLFGHFFPSLHPLSGCRYLMDLELNGKIEKLPGNMHALLPNLQRLQLLRSFLMDDPMPTLEKLPNLIMLELRRNFYCGKKITCREKGFRRLEDLILDAHLEEWQVEEGAMPVLSSLVIGTKSKFRVPERFRTILSYC